MNELATQSRGRFLSGSAAVAAGLAASTVPVRAQAAPLRVIYFAGGDAWGLYAGLEKGFFTRAGLNVTATATQGSVFQVSHMMSGDFDIALTAMDNLIAYDEGQGDPSVTGPFDLFAFMAMNEGLLQLVVRPDVASYDAIRGKRLAVDAIATGYSFVLRYMLDQKGVRDGDYTYVAVGSTERRLQALAQGQADAALVQSPFDLIGQQQYGLKILGSALDVLGHYQATVGMARRSWAATNRSALISFIRAYKQAVNWIYANRDEALAILARNGNMPADFAARAARLILDPTTGLRRDGSFDLAGVSTVLRLRSRFATPPKELGPVAKYVDQSYLRAAGS